MRLGRSFGAGSVTGEVEWVMMENRGYLPRLFARLLDLWLVALIVLIFRRLFPTVDVSFLIAFLLYQGVVIIFGGSTLGRYLLVVRIQTRLKGWRRVVVLSGRELLFWLLLPVLFLNVVNMTPQALHDRLTGTRVVRDDR
jgi:uncharacterized RDD family membrane protein YckC